MIRRVGVLVFFFIVSSGAWGQTWNAMDWIDGDYQQTTPTWQDQLGINWTRLSCRVSIRNTPAKCVDFVNSSPTPGITKYFLYITPDPKTILEVARQFSSASQNVPLLESVGFDDFFGAYETWYKQVPNAAQLVSQTIDNLKSSNPKLKFGITLYENELDPQSNPYIDDIHLPPAVKAKFDYIHLFLHYRKNGPSFARHVAQAQADFPNAKIIAGVYTYDRIDYFPCAQNDRSKIPCTEKEEMDYFKQALDIQVQLLEEGKVVGLELFPGYFGHEDKLYGPHTDNLDCKDVPRCIQNTITMRDMIRAAHAQFLKTVPPPSGR